MIYIIYLVFSFVSEIIIVMKKHTLVFDANIEVTSHFVQCAIYAVNIKETMLSCNTGSEVH